MALPVRRKRTGGEFLFLVDSQKALFDLDITFTEQATNAYSMFTQLQALIVEPVIPPTCSFRKVKSLYKQGRPLLAHAGKWSASNVE